MSHDALPEIDTLDPASLDRFTGALIDAGFAPDADPGAWVGPVDPAFAGLTDATTMRVVIRDGWPFRHPKVYVDGLGPRLHLNAAGDVCLWGVGDDSLEWLTPEGFRERIAAWCEEAKAGGGSENAGLDAHLYFRSQSPLLATIDTDALSASGFLKFAREASGELGAHIEERLIKIAKGGPVSVRWYYSTTVTVPPRDLDAFIAAVPAGRATNLERALRRTTERMVVLLLWHTAIGLNVLAVLVTPTSGGSPAVEALEVARTDVDILKLRAGPDAGTLRAKRAVVFGMGAIGSHAALLLARSGIGNLRLIDNERLRPADVTRHGTNGLFVAKMKQDAVKTMIELDAPWTSVKAVNEKPWAPDRIRALTSDVDLVVETTGSRAFAEQLGIVLREDVSAPALASIALYRGGAVARLQLQLATGPTILERTEGRGFPVIPTEPGEATDLRWETGCGAPVNNASPASVVSAAALAARVAIDVLVSRRATGCDIYETYEALDADGFRDVGLIVVPA